MKKRLVLGIVLMLSMVLAQCLHSGQQDSVLANSAQASDRAQQFFQSMGWNPSDSTPVIRAAAEPRANALEVQLDSLIAEVDPNTGQVCSAMNIDLVERAVAASVAGISDKEANDSAMRCLNAAGIPLDNARLYSSKLVRLGSDDSLTIWEVKFQRIYNGYAFYADDFIRVTLDPTDGTPSSFGYNFRSPLPDSTYVQVDKTSATGNAKSYLSELGVQAGSAIYTELQIVQPNEYWEYVAVGQTPVLPTISRLAWVIAFDGPWDRTEVWVDAVSGRVIGGMKTLSITKTDVAFPCLKGTKNILIASSDNMAAKRKILPSGSALGNALISQVPSLPRSEMSESKIDTILEFQGEHRAFTFGYSSADHRLTLLSGKYDGRQFQGHLAFEVSKTLGDLIDKSTK